MNKRILPPPIVLLSALAILLACFHESLIKWWCLRDLPKSLNQIYGETTQNKIPVYCFEDGFRAQIPIFKSSSSFYTSYDFNENYLKGLMLSMFRLMVRMKIVEVLGPKLKEL